MFEYAEVQLRFFFFKNIYTAQKSFFFVWGKKGLVNILQNIIFCVPHVKISHNDWEQLKNKVSI